MYTMLHKYFYAGELTCANSILNFTRSFCRLPYECDNVLSGKLSTIESVTVCELFGSQLLHTLLERMNLKSCTFQRIVGLSLSNVTVYVVGCCRFSIQWVLISTSLWNSPYIYSDQPIMFSQSLIILMSNIFCVRKGGE